MEAFKKDMKQAEQELVSAIEHYRHAYEEFKEAGDEESANVALRMAGGADHQLMRLRLGI